MTKLIITPDVISDYISLKSKPTVTFYKSGIVFNKSAKVNLALKKDCFFNFQIEEGKLYYSDAASGFKLSESGKGRIISSKSNGILQYVSDKLFLKNKAKQLKFEIGQFTEGRRELILLVA